MNPALRRGDRLVIASHNRGKIAEIAELIRPYGIGLVAAAELGLPEPEETATTFEGNARLKAVAAAQASGLPALSDDSGLCVDALGGDPGIYSARWAGPDKDFAAAMRLVEDRLQAAGATTPEQRGAHFVAVLSLAFPGGESREWRGEIAGTMVWPPRGNEGFGYDAAFLPAGESRTFGQMSATQKHGWRPGAAPLSHRARAFARFAGALPGPG